MKRFVITFVILLVVLVVVAVLGRNQLVKYGAPIVAKLAANIDLAIGNANIGLPETQAGLNQITIGNPAGFPDEPMISVPEVYVDYTIGGLMGDTTHLEELRLHVDRILIVRNKDGKINVKELLPPSEDTPDQPGRPGPPGEPEGPPRFRIDSLSLKIGDVVYRDYTFGDTPREQTFALNIDEQHANVTSAGGIAALIVGKALMNSSLSALANLDLDGFTSIAGPAFGQVGAALEQVEGAANALQSLTTNENVTGKLKDAGDALRKLF
jgi:uncharacterized protein involved in outer membrane biogenesis